MIRLFEKSIEELGEITMNPSSTPKERRAAETEIRALRATILRYKRVPSNLPVH